MSDEAIYLDYAATSPVDPAVLAVMQASLSLSGTFANPASDHAHGRAARAVVDAAREQIGALVNASGDRLAFTSGATESNNIALKGVFAGLKHPHHLITTRIEHLSVLDTARALAADGVAVSLLDCDAAGVVDPQAVAAALRPETRLVSIMQVNNEIGSVQPIAAIAALCRESGVALHVDAAQGAGKVPLDIDGWGIDLCSLTAHKVNGPKGVGALYVRESIPLAPFLHGGESELGIRAGTMPTHQIAGMGKAYELAAAGSEAAALSALRERLWSHLAHIPGIRRNGDPQRSAPHILNVSFPGVHGESLRFALPDLAVSAGSACTSSHPAPSHVLSALGLGDALAESSLRFGVGRFTTEAEVDAAAERVAAAVARLRDIAGDVPNWCSS